MHSKRGRLGAWGLATLAACAVTGTWLVGTAAGADSNAAPASKAGRLSDGHPDFNGSWDNGSGYDFIKPQKGEDGSICISGCKPAGAPAGAPDRLPRPRNRGARSPEVQAEFAAKVADLEKHQVDNDPVLRCRSPGLPRIGPPDKIVQRPGQIVFLYDDVSGSFWRIIPTDGSKHRDDADESYLGDAVGHWEGDALVVETVNFNEDSWLTDDGAFHTTGLRVVERLTRNGDTMEWQATAYDPAVLAEPWKVRPRKMVKIGEGAARACSLCGAGPQARGRWDSSR